MKMIDTHCHIHFNAYKQDMEEVIKRSLEKGIVMITVGTQKDTSARGVEVARTHDNVWAAIGLHPSHTFEQSFVDDEEIPEGQTIVSRMEIFDKDVYRALAKDKKCVAIGECGLDYYRLDEKIVGGAKQKQEAAFRAQIELADELDLPLIIHSRDAHNDTIRILSEFVKYDKLKKRGVAHCFGGTLAQAQDYFNLGFLISFTGIITFKPKKAEGDFSGIQMVAKEVPLGLVMIETDAPYISPEPNRGKRNEPCGVIEVAKKLALLKNVSFEEVVEQTNKNAKQLFGIEF